MSVYYNEHDAFAAAWLRLLMKAGVIADGEVDERDIRQIEPADLRGFAQCHFFAGIGVWSYSLRQAGWPDDKPVWTGSCPCQPFSVSGKRGGASDERHLWPAWFPLIVEAKPRAVPVLGEQVASDDGLAWLDLVSADMEGQGYAVGAVDTCAAGVGAPHIRQRLYFCAHAETAEILARPGEVRAGAGTDPTDGSGNNGHAGNSANTHGRHSSPEWLQRSGEQRLLAPHRGTGDTTHAPGERRQEHGGWPRPHSQSNAENYLRTPADSGLARLSARQLAQLSGARWWREGGATTESGPTNGFWFGCDWWYGRDGKYRPIEPGLFPLAHGAASRVGRLRGYGNALCAPQAVAFIQAAREVLRG